MSINSLNPLKARFFSAWGFFSRGILIIAIYVILHLIGLREYTSFISGTTSGGAGDLLGITYFIAYSLAVFVAPVAIIAALFMKISARYAGVED
ncbi:MAG: hypothetical protein CVV41_15460 [Candidatus Riflebacteria bacterium HGW-Riflebacteria-1]|jgi:hypothetical protein|nr:MAG: hypothetical protein CVV41_15460 [Candidatus Riflebacteria bacterium HGW-Riflebacteria-1]